MYETTLCWRFKSHSNKLNEVTKNKCWKGTSINNVTAIRRRVSRILVLMTVLKFLLKSVTVEEREVKNCVTFFMDDPTSNLTSYSNWNSFDDVIIQRQRPTTKIVTSLRDKNRKIILACFHATIDVQVTFPQFLTSFCVAT